MSDNKNRTKAISLIIAIGLLLTGCGDANENTATGNNSSPNNNTNNAIVEPSEPQTTTEDTVGDEQPSTDNEANKSTQSMVEAMLEKVEQPMLMDVSVEMVGDLYHLDPALLEQFTIKMPMMNVKTNEIAILKVKDAKDIPTIEDAVKQRATDVQKQFESYLPDQYENAKNYKVVVKENYVLFVISEQADNLINEFNSFFE